MKSDFYIKLRHLLRKRNSTPWITESHLNYMRERNKLCQLSKKENAKSIYTYFRNDLKNRLGAP